MKRKRRRNLEDIIRDFEEIRNFEIIEVDDMDSYESLPAIEIEYIDGTYETVVYDDWSELEDDADWLDRYIN